MKVFLVLLLCFSFCFTQNPIKLVSRTIYPEKTFSSVEPSNSKNIFGITDKIQLFVQIQEESLGNLASLEQETSLKFSPRQFISPNTFIVLTSLENTKKLFHQKSPSVSWYGKVQPDYKFYHYIKNSKHFDVYLLTSCQEECQKKFKEYLDSKGKNTLEKISDTAFRVSFQASREDVAKEILQEEIVELVQFVDTPILLNAFGTSIIQNGLSNTSPDKKAIWEKGIRGANEVITVADTGLDYDNCFFSESDGTPPPINNFDNKRRKVVGYYQINSDARIGDYVNGHGTHVAGSVAGKINNPSTDPQIKLDKSCGGAPDAKLAILAISKGDPWWWEGDASLILPSNYTDLFKTSVTGSRIFSNSWGSSVQVNYRAEEREVDNYLYYNDDTLVLFAAGNNGLLYGVSNPSIAKNVLSVAATETTPAGIESTSNYFDVDQAKTCCQNERLFFVCCPEKLRSTSILFSPRNTAFFSSRGYSLDDRIKPEVGSVGHIVQSARSDGRLDSKQCEDITPQGTNRAALVSMSGTSMATPLLSGNAGLVREYYRAGYLANGVRDEAKGFVPSGALLKATLIHSGDTSSPPNQFLGYGRAALSSVLRFADSTFNLLVKDRVEILNSETKFYYLRATGNSQFKASLVWFDPGNSPSSKSALVNDLDLDVFVNGAHFPGNGVLRDDLNSNEQSIANGVKTNDEIFVRVTGRRVVFTTKFAIVLTGNFVEVPPPARSCFGLPFTDGKSCSGFGFCSSNDVCNCTAGHSGPQCQDFTCRGIAPSASNVCAGNGKCVFGNKCDCTNPDQYTGRNCDIPVCFGISGNQTVVCGRNGECIAPNQCKCTIATGSPDCTANTNGLSSTIFILWAIFTVVCGLCFGVSCLGFVAFGFVMTRRTN